jgi:succinate dehydrogenase / fumarate reductase, membrane anchor subunit
MKNHALNKWMIQRVSAVVLIPLLLFFLYSLVDLVNRGLHRSARFF